MISPFLYRIDFYPSRSTNKLKMDEEKNIVSNSRPKKPKFPKNLRNPSNLRRFSRRSAHQFNFSNTVDDPKEVEEMEDPFESSKQELDFEGEA